MLILYLFLFFASTLAYVQPPPVLYDLEDAENIFEEFIKKYNKVYADEQEKQERFNIFKEKLELVNKLRLEQPQASFDIHASSDLTQDEIRARHLGYIPNTSSSVEPETVTVREGLPESFDWRDHNAVTPVKNQGSCGSCWSFATTGTIEGAYAIKHKKLESFSEQELVSCDTRDHGCNGGNMEDALEYLTALGGIETEKDYPYEGKSSSGCKFNKSKVVAKITGYKTFTLGNDEQTKQALVDNGPLSIGLAAGDTFQSYTHGVLKCPTSQDLNHAVLLIGYGTENGVPYWLIKNSWGTVRGDKGYWKVRRGSNPCGMDYEPAVLAQVA